MINVMNSVKTSTNEVEKSLDSQLWHACAGGMVKIPPLNSQVFYFPQGHAEHAASENVDIPRILPYILCRLSSIKFMAESDSDEVYAKIGLTPAKNQNKYDPEDDLGLGFDQNKNQENEENPTSFAKTLTQSDANNGGGFSVPRYCAETIFPRLDYTADPPVQNILAKDVHGQIWKFRHIYRGTPRRHLLTTGWSNFVNNKKLVAGDSIVFLRAENGDLCVGVRRGRRGNKGDLFSGYAKVDENNKLFMRNMKRHFSSEAVIEAANLAAKGEPFNVYYHPRASTPEFCVRASVVKAAMHVQWHPGMRFKMAFEADDSSRISWFMGTVSSVDVNDHIRWPNSPWRFLQVTWDEPDLLQNVKRVNPWDVEIVSNMSAIQLPPLSQPRKKLRIPQIPDFPLPTTATANNITTSIQGARHNSQIGSENNNQTQFNKIQSFSFGILNDDPLRRPPLKDAEKTKETQEKVSSLLTMGTDYTKPSLKKHDDNEKDKRKPMFVLFGQPILTEQQLTESWSGDVAPNLSDGSVVLQNGPVESSSEEQ